MKDHLSIPMYAWHHVVGVALYYGYDFERELEEFLPNEALEQVEHSLSTGEAVTLMDWYKASKQVYTDNFIAFVMAVNKLYQEDVDGFSDTTPLLVSNHSGSSDYFTLGMVRSFAEAYSDFKK